MFEHNAKWSCHFDDDTFVNYNMLRKVLHSYDDSKPVYVGRQSIRRAINITHSLFETPTKSSFHFATGGAGWCLSRPLLVEMERLLRRQTFRSISSETRLPDDMTVGFIVEVLLGVEMIEDTRFNSHLNHLASLDPFLQVRIIIKITDREKVYSRTKKAFSCPHDVYYLCKCKLD